MNKLKSMNPSSKIWVYTSKSNINKDNAKIINLFAETFINQWESHGNKVKGNIEIVDDYFIVVAADEECDTMCGRAKDAIVRLIKEIELETDLIFTDRMTVALKIDDKISTSNYNDVKERLENDVFPENTKIYNPLISTVKEYNESFIQVISDSWLV